MNCPKCNFSIPEGDAFCPNCGASVNAPVSEPMISTPVDGLNLRGCATVAPETPVYAAPVNKPSKGLAIAAYILYAIAILVFAFFILVMGFGLDFSRSSGSLKLPAGDIAVTVKPGGSVTIPAGHPVYTEMNAATAEELMAIYEKYDAFGVCPGRETMLSESETSRFLGDVGGNPDDYMHYSVFRMNDCKEENLCLTLPFVSGGKEYLFTDEDTGEELYANDGKLDLFFANPHEAKLLWVKRKN